MNQPDCSNIDAKTRSGYHISSHLSQID